MIIKSSVGRVEKYTPFSHAKLSGNSKSIDEILRMAGLEDIFNENEQFLPLNVGKEPDMEK